jgi:uncharacterized membrane protein YdjX (TVP38/TMEM64 family)
MEECCERVRKITPAQWRWIKLVAFILLIITVSGLLYGYRDDIFDGLRDMATWMRAAGFGGVVLMVMWAFMTSFPPMPLRETGMRLTGYVWGVPWGFVIAFSGSFIGSIGCFLVGRYLFQARVNKWIAGDKHLTAIKQSLSHGGFKLIVLLRIGPFPFSWMSLFLSATDVDLKTYLGATLFGLQWVWYQVWIGTVLDNVEAAANLDFSATSTKVNIGVAFASAILSLLAMYYIKRVVDTILRKDAAREAEATHSDLTPGSDDAPPTLSEMDMPAGFARRFTPPSHALWTSQKQVKPDSSQEKKEEGTEMVQLGDSKPSTEIVSVQDSTAGFISGPLVDLEMVARAVTNARHSGADQTKKALTEGAKTLENPEESAESQGTERGSRGKTMTLPKKTSEERARGETALF